MLSGKCVEIVPQFRSGIQCWRSHKCTCSIFRFYPVCCLKEIDLLPVYPQRDWSDNCHAPSLLSRTPTSLMSILRVYKGHRTEAIALCRLAPCQRKCIQYGPACWSFQNQSIGSWQWRRRISFLFTSAAEMPAFSTMAVRIAFIFLMSILSVSNVLSVEIDFRSTKGINGTELSIPWALFQIILPFFAEGCLEHSAQASRSNVLTLVMPIS